MKKLYEFQLPGSTGAQKDQLPVQGPPGDERQSHILNSEV